MAKNPVGRPRKSPIFNKPAGRDYVPPMFDREPEPDFNLISAEKKAELREEARKKVAAQEEARAMDAFLEAEIKRIEKELHPEVHEEEREVEVDLALYADKIILDGRQYMHGRKYTVKKSVYDALQDIMYRTRKHYSETHRDPMRAMQEAAQAIAKGGSSFAVLNASTGGVQRF